MSNRPTVAEVERILRDLPGTVTARLCGITPRHLRRIAKAAHIPKPIGGRYDAFATLDGFHDYMASNEGDAGLAETRKAIEVERLRKLKNENELAESRLVPVDDFFATGAAMSQTFVAGMESLPGRLATVLAGENEPAVVRNVLMGEVRRVRQNVSDTFARMAREKTLDPGEV